jgi:RNA 2',3'-cyclic 3'-phosphodiesterase
MPRLFTALALPQDICDMLMPFMLKGAGVREIEREDLHITLCFIGDVSVKEANEIHAGLMAQKQFSPTITLQAIDFFGSKKPHSLICRLKEEPDLMELQEAQEKMLRRLNIAQEDRKFTPHITLNRIKGYSSADVLAHIAGLGAFRAVTFMPEVFSLYEAKASTGGGPYMRLADFPLVA